MPAITTVHESLPYIDPDPTPSERAAAEALIAAERSLVPDDPHHALLPPPPPTSGSPFLTPLLAAELSRVASALSSTSSSSSSSSDDPSKKAKLSALDLARYEAPDPPAASDLAALPTAESRAALLQGRLRRAYAARAYVASRRAHLALLDAHGRNAWLAGNHALEGELARLERELGEARRAVDQLTVRRREAQEQAGPELASLEDAWKRGVGRVLETEAAAESLRREVLALRRRMAADNSVAVSGADGVRLGVET